MGVATPPLKVICIRPGTAAQRIDFIRGAVTNIIKTVVSVAAGFTVRALITAERVVARSTAQAVVTTGTVTYAGTGGVPEKDVVILEVKDGQPTFVEAVRPTNIPS